jgi:sporulation-control protein
VYQMIWKQFLSSIGIGHVKVDTLVYNTNLSPGETIEGEVVIEGGMADQPITEITLLLVLKYEEDKEDSDFPYHEKDIEGITLNNIGTIQSEEKKRIPFSFLLSKNHPISTEKQETFLRTTIDIPQAVNPTDEDSIIVKKYD